MTHNKYFPTLVFGFAAAVLTIIPGLRSFACCLIIPAASWLAIYISQRMNNFENGITSSIAFKFGALTGLYAALFSTIIEILMTYILKSNEITQTLPQIEILFSQYNLGGMMDESLKLIHQMADDIEKYGFSLLFTFFLLFNNLLVDIIFGIVGGFIGMAFLNKKYNNPE